ncbi:MAG: hypothetical protein ACMUIL_12550 [bacterium]
MPLESRSTGWHETQFIDTRNTLPNQIINPSDSRLTESRPPSHGASCPSIKKDGPTGHAANGSLQGGAMRQDIRVGFGLRPAN